MALQFIATHSMWREQGQRYMCQTTPAAIAQAGNGLFVVKLGWVWLGEAVDTQQERPN
jgi:hypothetical protein